jgi:hypothetical protein
VGPEEMAWAPDSCTLPSTERPVRAAEFDDLFAAAGSGSERVAPTHLRFSLRGDHGLESRVRDLARRESACCSFFTFDVSVSGACVTLDAQVDARHVPVLDALARRYQDRVRGQ